MSHQKKEFETQSFTSVAIKAHQTIASKVQTQPTLSVLFAVVIQRMSVGKSCSISTCKWVLSLMSCLCIGSSWKSKESWSFDDEQDAQKKSRSLQWLPNTCANLKCLAPKDFCHMMEASNKQSRKILSHLFCIVTCKSCANKTPPTWSTWIATWAQHHWQLLFHPSAEPNSKTQAMKKSQNCNVDS